MRKINFLYKNHKGSLEDRVVTVLMVSFKDSIYHGVCWVMTGYCHNREDIRDFKIEEMEAFSLEDLIKLIK